MGLGRGGGLRFVPGDGAAQVIFVAVRKDRPAGPRVPLNGTDASAPFDWAGYASKAAMFAGFMMIWKAIQRGRK